MSHIESALYTLDDAHYRKINEKDVISALNIVIREDKIDEVNYTDFVYYPEALTILLKTMSKLDEQYIYTMFNRIIEYDLSTYPIIFNYLLNIKWTSNTDYLRLRPYLLVNIDRNKISELYNTFNLVDPRFMNLFYNMDFIYNNDLNSKYFGYRKSWYNLFYETDEIKIKTIIQYTLYRLDCSTSGLIDYILWLNNINVKDVKLYEKFVEHYEEILPDSSTNVIYNTLFLLNESKIHKSNEIIKIL